MQFKLAIAAFVAASLLATSAIAQTYPTRPIHVIVPFPPGSFNDTIGRTIAQKFGEDGFGQAIVENRPGAGSTIGAAIAARSPNDGYTLLVVALPFAVNQTLYKHLPYNTLRDFEAVAYAGSTSNLLVANPTVPVKTMSDLINLAKARPGQLLFASGGYGTSPYMALELIRMMTGIKVVHVPYKGSPPAVTDLLAGNVMLYCEILPVMLPYVEDGKLRAIAVTAPKRVPQLPQVPAMDETIPGLHMTAWFGVVAPAGTPHAIVDKLNAEINRILAMPDVRRRFGKLAVEPGGGSPQAFAARLKAEVAKWAQVIKATGAHIR